MKLVISGVAYEVSAPLFCVLNYVVLYANDFNIPLDIIFIKKDKFIINSLGWTEQLLYKLKYHLNKGYSEFCKPDILVCEIEKAEIRVEVDSNYKIKRYEL